MSEPYEVSENGLTKCAYCGWDVPAPESEEERPLAVDDETAWAELADYHKTGCEWIRTRAHRLEVVHL